MVPFFDTPRAKAGAATIAFSLVLGIGGGLKFLTEQERQSQVLAAVQQDVSMIKLVVYRSPELQELLKTIVEEERARDPILGR